MKNMLKEMFKVFNREVEDGDYFVDSRRNEIGLVVDGGAGLICKLNEVEYVSFNGSRILLETTAETYHLTKTGVEF